MHIQILSVKLFERGGFHLLNLAAKCKQQNADKTPDGIFLLPYVHRAKQWSIDVSVYHSSTIDQCTFHASLEMWSDMFSTRWNKIHSKSQCQLCMIQDVVINPPATVVFPSPSPVTSSFDASFDLSLYKRLSKQARRRWLYIYIYKCVVFWVWCSFIIVLWFSYTNVWLINRVMIWCLFKEL